VQMGYRNRRLVPSLATALGTSADQPAALATLMSIIANEGLRLPEVKMKKVALAGGSPYEVTLVRRRVEGERVLSQEVVQQAKKVLFDIVSNGTAIRLHSGLPGRDSPHRVGGKTGTGDNRAKVFGKGGVLKESHVMNRTATFMFLIGDYLFGTITVFVEGEAADAFEFTSSLPVQILKSMGPLLQPLADEARARQAKSAS